SEEVVLVERTKELKAAGLDEIDQVGSPRRQRDGSGVGGKLHVDEGISDGMADQQPVAEGPSDEVLKEVTVEDRRWLARRDRQSEVEEFASGVRENRWNNTGWRILQRDGGRTLREVIDLHEHESPRPADPGKESHECQGTQRGDPRLGVDGHVFLPKGLEGK